MRHLGSGLAWCKDVSDTGSLIDIARRSRGDKADPDFQTEYLWENTPNSVRRLQVVEVSEFRSSVSATLPLGPVVWRNTRRCWTTAPKAAAGSPHNAII